MVNVPTDSPTPAREDAASRRIRIFTQDYPEAVAVAYHAAFPLTLTTDLVYCLREQFVPECPWHTAADVLLSGLCQPVGHDLYEMEPDTRNQLLQALKEQFGEQRLFDLEDFMVAYIQHRLAVEKTDAPKLLSGPPQWTALSCLRPGEAVERIQQDLQRLVTNGTPQERFRLSALVESYADLLATSGYQPLLLNLTDNIASQPSPIQIKWFEGTYKSQIEPGVEYIAEVAIKAKKIAVCFGNLEKLNVDAIVSPDNGILSASSGVANSIYRATKGRVYDEAHQALRERLLLIEGHQLSIGEVIITSGGSLQASRIFHVVTNAYIDPYSTEKIYQRIADKDDVKRIVSKCIKEANDLQIESIGFPLMAQKAMSLKVEESLELIFNQIYASLVRLPNNATLKEIKIVIHANLKILTSLIRRKDIEKAILRIIQSIDHHPFQGFVDPDKDFYSKTPDPQKLKRENSFLTYEKIKKVVETSSEIRSGETLCEIMLVFQNQKQRTWLVSTDQHVFFLLDSRKNRQKKQITQYKQTLQESLPVRTSLTDREPYGCNFTLGSSHTWYYSKDILGNISQARRKLEEFIQGAISGIKLQSFTFKTATVDAQGEIVREGQDKRSYYLEPLTGILKENDVVKDIFSNYGVMSILETGELLPMVKISAGQFQMGSQVNEIGHRKNESQERAVNVSGFFISKYPITQAQWRAIADLPVVKRELKKDPSHFKGRNRPVENVNWYDAIEFCARLSLYTNRDYSLPTEVMWEYACRAGTTTPFHFGETITTDLANYRGADWEYGGQTYPGNYGSGPKGIHRGETTEVGTFPANKFGLYDMHGNIWEWCKLHQDERLTGKSSSAGDYPSQPIRGGSWSTDPRLCRSAFRDYSFPDNCLNVIGFRVVCSAF